METLRKKQELRHRPLCLYFWSYQMMKKVTQVVFLVKWYDQLLTKKDLDVTFTAEVVLLPG
jgi:hypothetical protein